jgi:dipeptidyl-peptidase 4
MVRRDVRALLAVVIGVFWSASLYAQDRSLTLTEIWNEQFTPAGLQSIRSLPDGGHFTVLGKNAASNAMEINKYDYASGRKTGVIFSSSNYPELTGIFDYELSPDEQKLLIKTQRRAQYRHSYFAQHFLYDLIDKTLVKIEGPDLQEVTFSPDGKYLAFVRSNNLYYWIISEQKRVQVTQDGRQNHIINGLTDWVYEEEFGFVQAYQWSRDSDYLAYLRFDESEVAEFSMDVYGQDLYPTQSVFKYPKAGEKNAQVSLHIHQLNKGSTSDIDLTQWPYEYIPRIKWSKNPDQLAVQLLNRAQNDLVLLQVDMRENQTRVLLQEHDEAYVDIHDDLTFLNDNSFIWPSEQDGWRHLYHYNAQGELIRQLTQGNYDVTAFYGFNPRIGRLYFQSSKRGSIYRDIYSMNISGTNTVRFSQDKGTNEADFSADFSHFIQKYSSVTTPNRFTLNSGLNGSELRVLEDNSVLHDLVNRYGLNPKTFDSIYVNGNWLNTYVIKPKSIDLTKKYPVLMFQYSGPGSQQVADRWNNANDYWHQYLVDQGLIVVCVDGRGTGLKGRDFKKVTQGKLGLYEVQDQIAAAQQIAKWSNVNPDKIGIWGWSYGGFMSANCLFQGEGVFSMAISVAPVTSWRFYDSIYTERYMGLPQDNAQGYDAYAPLDHVSKMNGDLLLVHGTADDNVHVQNSMRLIDALVKANKPFDWLIYPDKNHGIYGGYTRQHLYRKMTDFIQKNLMTNQ